MSRRRAKRTHEDQHESPALRDDAVRERSGAESSSPQQGVARLQEAAGNDAVSGMLQRFHGSEHSGTATKRASTLRRGSRGASVELLQTQLNAAGFGPLKVDGIFGPLTQKSVRSFQREHRLVPDAVVGRNTWARLGVVGGGGAQLPTKAGADAPDLRGVQRELGAGGGVQATMLRDLTLRNLEGADSGVRQLAGSLADAVGEAWTTWQSAATMIGIMVNAVSATGGQVVGPQLSALILPRAAAVDSVAGKALANSIGLAFDTFAATLKMPGLPVFPSFAAFPGPVAPPTPSVPVPLLALAGAQPTPQKAEFQSLSSTQRQACEAVADSFGPAMEVWRASTIVSVIGSGPVPTYAPPYVPVGPVVGGIANGVPGAFMR